ncbi:hypothetical protein EYR41_003391 [Orbilia oligospora]|uniref:Uncharacterized protein n=1 Tax=Orbilia oligospora TaxID=2813651 RepID=A0A7C8K687_ORBOL|nr:hypothetical protein TWF751_010499 [Orbilia oligospora]TGJ71427.1 hypothetical protein EYR41_003391 [Orbilia oligospora]
MATGGSNIRRRNGPEMQSRNQGLFGTGSRLPGTFDTPSTDYNTRGVAESQSCECPPGPCYCNGQSSYTARRRAEERIAIEAIAAADIVEQNSGFRGQFDFGLGAGSTSDNIAESRSRHSSRPRHSPHSRRSSHSRHSSRGRGRTQSVSNDDTVVAQTEASESLNGTYPDFEMPQYVTYRDLIIHPVSGQYEGIRNTYQKPWWKEPGLRKLNLTIGTLYLSAVGNGYCSSVIGGLLNIDSFRSLAKVSDHFAMRTFLLITHLPIGAICSLLLAASFSDKHGRRAALLVGSGIMIAAALMQGLVCTNYTCVSITRVTLGAGIGVCQVAAPTLALEIAIPRHRDFVGIYYNAFWYLGSVISAIVTYAAARYRMDSIWGWRVPCVLQGLFPFLQLLFAIYPGIPESPRYLCSVLKNHEALRVVARYHGEDEDFVDSEVPPDRWYKRIWKGLFSTSKQVGREEREEPNTREEGAEGRQGETFRRREMSADKLAVLQEIESIKAVLLSEEYHARLERGDEDLGELAHYEYQGMQEQKFKYREIFKSSKNLKRFFIAVFVGAMIQWAGNGVVGWYLYPTFNSLGFRNQTEAAIINIGLQVWNLIWATVGAFMSLWIRRRTLWITTTFGMMIPIAGIAGVLSQASSVSGSTGEQTRIQGLCLMVFVFLYWAIYDVSYTPLQVGYVVEVLPYRWRSIGLAVNWCSVMVFGTFQQFIAAVGIKSMTWRYYLVNIGVLGFFLIVIWFFFPETQDIPLEMVQFIFDKEHQEAIQKARVKGAKKRKAELRRIYGIGSQRNMDEESEVGTGSTSMNEQRSLLNGSGGGSRRSRDNSIREPSRDGSTRGTNQNNSVRGRSRDGSVRRPSRDNSIRRSSQDGSMRGPSRNRPIERPSRQNSIERPGQGHSIAMPSRNYSIERPSRNHSTERPGQDHFTERPSRNHSMERLSRDNHIERPSRDSSARRSNRGDSIRESRRDSFIEPVRDNTIERPRRDSSRGRPSRDNSRGTLGRDNSRRPSRDNSTRGSGREGYIQRNSRDNHIEAADPGSSETESDIGMAV